MNRKVRVSNCDVGKGVFAEIDLPEGEVILYVTGRILDRAQNDSIYLEGENSVQVATDRYIDPTYPAVFLNHSCMPNAGIDSELRLVALRDIAADEEIRFDYSTSMLERNWTMKCRCGEANCRGVIDDFDRLPRSVRDFYLDRHVVQDFIVDKLADSSDSDESAA